MRCSKVALAVLLSSINLCLSQAPGDSYSTAFLLEANPANNAIKERLSLAGTKISKGDSSSWHVMQKNDGKRPVISADCTFVPPAVSPCVTQNYYQPVQQNYNYNYQNQQASQSGYGCNAPCRPRPACRPRCPCRRPPTCKPPPPPTTTTMPPTTTPKFSAQELRERKAFKKMDRKEFHADKGVAEDDLFALLHPELAKKEKETGVVEEIPEKKRKTKTCNAQPITTTPAPTSSVAPADSSGSQPQSFGAQPQSFGAQPQSFGAQPQSFGAQPQSYGAQPQQSSYGQSPPAPSTSYGQSPPAPSNSYGQNDGYAMQPPASGGYGGGSYAAPQPAGYGDAASSGYGYGGYEITTEAPKPVEPFCDFFIIEYPNEFLLLSDATQKKIKSIWQGFTAGSDACSPKEQETKKLLESLTGKDKEEVEFMLSCYPDHSKEVSAAALKAVKQVALEKKAVFRKAAAVV
uniref:Uncharacterized protein n=1 Tax=Plectus sambesii TaxID=2011161 RepID=A0A914UVB0_9BILA